MQPLILMGIMFAVFYFLLIRPQVKRQKEHQRMLEALKKGDEVVTRGGLIGKITGITDDILVIELQEKVRVRVRRGAVETKYERTKSDKSQSQSSKKSKSKKAA
jgi:preprotein translocase subunit YajC